MYQRIFVAVDGSDTSRRAFETALNLAASLNATLQLYHVVENSPTYFETPGYDPSILRQQLITQSEELREQLTAAMRARNVHGEMVCAEASSIDDLPTALLKAATEFNADLLVMGTHGRRGVKRLILGSVAERCLRQAALPVLLIPSAAGQPAESEQTA